MLTIQLNTEAFQEKLATMEEQLKDFPNDMAKELTEWQTEDMHRHYPNTKQEEKAVSTEIWPTSRTAEKDGRKVKAALRKIARRSNGTVVRKAGYRPVLRPQLFDKLALRMLDLMKECLKWQ